jgi:hypothetical protein
MFLTLLYQFSMSSWRAGKIDGMRGPLLPGGKDLLTLEMGAGFSSWTYLRPTYTGLPTFR